MSTLTVIGGTSEQIQECFERYAEEHKIKKKSPKDKTDIVRKR